MDLQAAKQKFIELTANINPEIVCEFLKWIQESEKFKFKESADIILENIADDIRGAVPFEAVLPSENTVVPSTGKNADCREEVTLHVDNFLYSDDYLDDLVEKGEFSRNYCNACGSRDTKPFTFISHSASPELLRFIFKRALPDLTNKIVVDVGSRLGPILYAAHLYTSCQKIIGIEINKDLCEIQHQVLKKYEMSNRVSVINADVMDCANVLSSADIVIMNNVFEFFAEASQLVNLWQFMMNVLKGPGRVLLTIPSLEESLDNVGMSHLMESVEEVQLNYDGMDDSEDVHLYKLK